MRVELTKKTIKKTNLQAHIKPTDFRPLSHRQTHWRLATQMFEQNICISGFFGPLVCLWAQKLKAQVEQTAGRGRVQAWGAAKKPHAEFYALGKRFRFRCPPVFYLLSPLFGPLVIRISLLRFIFVDRS